MWLVLRRGRQKGWREPRVTQHGWYSGEAGRNPAQLGEHRCHLPAVECAPLPAKPSDVLGEKCECTTIPGVFFSPFFLMRSRYCTAFGRGRVEAGRGPSSVWVAVRPGGWSFQSIRSLHPVRPVPWLRSPGVAAPRTWPRRSEAGRGDRRASPAGLHRVPAVPGAAAPPPLPRQQPARVGIKNKTLAPRRQGRAVHTAEPSSAPLFCRFFFPFSPFFLLQEENAPSALSAQSRARPAAPRGPGRRRRAGGAGWRGRPAGCCACAWDGAACTWLWATRCGRAGSGCGAALLREPCGPAAPGPPQVRTARGRGGPGGRRRPTEWRSTCCGSTSSTVTRRHRPGRGSAGETRCAASARCPQVSALRGRRRRAAPRGQSIAGVGLGERGGGEK